MGRETDLPTYRCRRIDLPLPLDGNPNKPEWIKVDPVWLVPADGRAVRPFWDDPRVTAFLAAGADGNPDQSLPGDMPYQPTRFRAGWSETHLFLGFQCLDSDIWGRYTRRDDPIYEQEVVEAFLSPTGDISRYYEFEVSPRNTVFDATVHSPDLRRESMTVNLTWNCQGMETAALVNGKLGGRQDRDLWWGVEMAIPFAAFAEVHPPRRGDTWRANFYRIDSAGSGEFTCWSPTLTKPANFHVPSRFGYLRFE